MPGQEGMGARCYHPRAVSRTTAARALFDQNGVEGVSMRRIADKAGITAMAIYKHYPDKDALLNALMLDGFAAWEARVEKIREPEPLDALAVDQCVYFRAVQAV